MPEATYTKAEDSTIVFNQSKKETFTLNQHFTEICKFLKSSWKIVVNKDDITYERLSIVKLFVIPGATEKFSAAELIHSKNTLRMEGLYLFLWVRTFGIMVNSGKLAVQNFL
ncbi:unnamed protein product [Heterobilharzia americana]|nr:unnamed protein product [Heterobilharzia americana]